MSGRPRSLSVRAGTVLGATAAMTLALFVGALILRAQLRDALYSSVEDQARTLAAGEASLVATGDYSPILASTSSLPSWVQVVNARGQVLASTANITQLKTPFAPLPSQTRLYVRDLSGLPIDTGERLAVASVSVKADSETLYILAAVPLDVADVADGRIVRVLIIVFPALLAMSALVVAMMARRALRPVEQIRTQVSTISTSDLSRRVPVPLGNDEISRLAKTMNEMLERLQHSTEQQRRFVGDASHELRSPLASLRAQLEVSTLERADKTWAITVRDMLIDHDRIDRLVRDLLLLARFDAHEPLTLEPLDLGYLVRREVSRRLPTPAVTITVDADNVLIAGHDDSVSRIVRNLVDNAERHAATQVRISVHARSEKAVELVVEDDGPGIPEEERERVFQRFTRLDGARASDDGGSGLGLAIVADLIAVHQGRISIEPSTKGARFVATFPILVN
jgi:signal transduction histidine kinase